MPPITRKLDDINKHYIGAQLEHLGVGLKNSGLRDALIDELAYCIFPRVHEGKVAPYGCIIVNKHAGQYRFPQSYSWTQFRSRAAGRLIADGVSSFVWRDTRKARDGGWNGVISCAGWLASDELEAFVIRDTALRGDDSAAPQGVEDFLIVQRHDGVTRAFTSDRIIQVWDNIWEARPYQYDFRLADLISSEWPDRLRAEDSLLRVARSVARIAVHMLSPKRIGATIVLCVGEAAENSSVFNWNNEVKLTPTRDQWGLTTAHPNKHHSIVNLARQLDGAILVRSDGAVAGSQIWFDLPTEAISSRKSVGGTRQLSAQEASKAVDGVIVTVSSDGPVRAFVRGELRLSTSRAESKRNP